jgi:hypothetical protein
VITRDSTEIGVRVLGIEDLHLGHAIDNAIEA